MKEILIYGAIGWEADPQDIVRQFQDAAGEDVLLRIHSEGGSVYDGLAIISAIRSHDGTVSAQIDGMAFSMAAVIALEVRENLTMPEDAWIMFHEVRNGAGGQVEDLERQITQMKAMNESVAAKLGVAMGISADAAAELLNKEIWMTGAEAHEAGIVPHLSPAQALAAHVKQGRWPNAPAKIFEKLGTTKQTQNDMKLFKLFTSKGENPSLEVAELGPEDMGAELTALQKDLDEIKATHAAALVAREEKHSNELTAKDEAHKAELTAKLDELKTELVATHAAELAAKDEAIKSAETSADEKANAILAQAGHKVVQTTSPDEKTVLEKYQAMSAGPERLKFRKDHKDELEALAGPGVLR